MPTGAPMFPPVHQCFHQALTSVFTSAPDVLINTQIPPPINQIRLHQSRLSQVVSNWVELGQIRLEQTRLDGARFKTH